MSESIASMLSKPPPYEDTTLTPVPFYKKGYIPAPKELTECEEICSVPHSVYSYLDENVYGHPHYKRALSVFLWKCYKHHRPKGALLVAGQSGSGKTEMIRAIKQIYSNIYVCDASTITPQGFKGNSKLYSGLQNLDFNPEFPMPILVIDEIDKLLLRDYTGTTGVSPWPELLKMLEGGTINIGTEEKPNIINTDNVGFILLGAFSPLREVETSPIGFCTDVQTTTSPLTKDAVLNEIPPELRGRIEQTIILGDLNESDYYNILTDKRYSPVNKIHEELGISLHISDSITKEISHNAFTEGTGVRSMNNVINEYVNGVLFENPDIKTINITKLEVS